MGVLHLAIENKCIWTTDFLQLFLASIITLLRDEKLYPISLSVCNSFKHFTLQEFPSFPPSSFMQSEILCPYNPAYQHFTLGWQFSKKIHKARTDTRTKWHAVISELFITFQNTQLPFPCNSPQRFILMFARAARKQLLRSHWCLWVCSSSHIWMGLPNACLRREMSLKKCAALKATGISEVSCSQVLKRPYAGDLHVPLMCPQVFSVKLILPSRCLTPSPSTNKMSKSTPNHSQHDLLNTAPELCCAEAAPINLSLEPIPI